MTLKVPREPEVLTAGTAEVEPPNVFVRSHALFLSRAATTDATLAKVSQLAGREVKPEDVYPFRMVAASDGVDSYWTQHDLEESLKPMAKDLQRGQTVLGNHAYDTFGYGSSIDGNVQAADTTSPIFEETFHRGRKVSDDLKTKNWLVGDYFIARGLELNGEKTDSIIRAMELGAVRKASISFIVDQFRCGIDGKDMLMARLFAAADPGKKRHEIDETVCMHLPGTEYEEGTAWAQMLGSQCIETSLVYKNASPSALMLRKAEALAGAGLLSTAQVVQAEAQFGVRLPLHGRRVWVAGKEVSVAGRHPEPNEEIDSKEGLEPEPVPKPEAVGEPDAEEEEDDEEEPATAEAVTSAFVAASSAVRSALTANLMGSEHMDAVASAALALDGDLAPRSTNAVSSVTERHADGARKVRDREVEEELGRPISLEAIRSLKADADLGSQMFEQLVLDAVASRNGLGAAYDETAYKRMLGASRSIEFVKAEKSSYDALKAERFKVGRQVTPGPIRQDEKKRKTTRASTEDDQNIFVPRRDKSPKEE